MERKCVGRLYLNAYLPPHRWNLRFGISGSQQQLSLMRTQCSNRFRTRWPPLESPFGQSFGCEPQALAVILQKSDRCSASGPKDKQPARKWIGIQFLAAQLRECIKPLTTVNGLHCN